MSRKVFLSFLRRKKATVNLCWTWLVLPLRFSCSPAFSNVWMASLLALKPYYSVKCLVIAVDSDTRNISPLFTRLTISKLKSKVSIMLAAAYQCDREHAAGSVLLKSRTQPATQTSLPEILISFLTSRWRWFFVGNISNSLFFPAYVLSVFVQVRRLKGWWWCCPCMLLLARTLSCFSSFALGEAAAVSGFYSLPPLIIILIPVNCWVRC